MSWRNRCFCIAWVVAVMSELSFGQTAVHATSLSSAIKLAASNPGQDELFGVSVGISGDMAIVGAHFDDDAGANAGAAHVFEATTGNQLFELVASDAAWQDNFGNSVALDSDIAIVGAFKSGVGNPGSAYLFDLKIGNQLLRLIGSDTGSGDLFGSSVAISGKKAVVGSVRHDPARVEDAGAAYVFDVTTGAQLFKLTSPEIKQGDLFGYSVSVSGNVAIVGAPQGFVGAGYAYLYDVTTGSQLFKLTSQDAEFFDVFGGSVAISGNTAIVGSPGNDGSGDAAGAAYLFDVTTGAQLHKLTPFDARADDRFGSSVAISGNLAIVGAPMDDDSGGSSGSAYIFDVTTGEQLAKLIAFDGWAGAEFGHSVAISGGSTIVGAWYASYYDNGWGASGAGAAYLFVPEPSTCLLLASAGILGAWRRR